MGVDQAAPLQLRRTVARQASSERVAKPQPKISRNALLGMGLWLLLWMGYNTTYDPLLDPNSTPIELLHGIRAFFPMLAGWFAALVIMARSNRAVKWVAGPLGLMLIYAVTGLVSTAAFLDNPVGGLYYGANYLAIVLVLLAIVPVDDPLPDLRYVIKLTWMVGALMTLSLLGVAPHQAAEAGADGGAMPAYAHVNNIMGMAGTRNTGFARYAAISALVALPWLWRKTSRSTRIAWALLFAASTYALVIANGRTEILAFIFSVFLVLVSERANRTLFLIVGVGAAILLAIAGFFGGFFLYFTRTGHVDSTLTGRTATWEEGIQIFWRSPLVGLGFQSDRLYLGLHMHNAFLHSLFQAGFLGGGDTHCHRSDLVLSHQVFLFEPAG